MSCSFMKIHGVKMAKVCTMLFIEYYYFSVIITCNIVRCTNYWTCSSFTPD